MSAEPKVKDSTHTPGPWELHAEVEGHNSVRICKPDAAAFRGCWSIAEADILGADRKEVEANARLIAAAPELYEAVEAVWAWLGEGSTEPWPDEDAYTKVLNALKKVSVQ